MEFVTDWFKRHFANRQLVILIIVIASIGVAIYLFGHIMTPVIAAVVISYLLQGLVKRVERFSVPPRLAFWIVFTLSMTAFVLLVLGLIPLLFREVAALIQQVPQMMSEARRILSELPSQYPDLITKEQIDQLASNLRAEILDAGQTLLSYSFTSALTVITIIVYAVLVPLMVFFMVKDKDTILTWLLGFLPEERDLTNQVWRDIDGMIDRYIQGKIWEILIIGSVTYVVFELLGLQYALLLAAVTGLSVLIPYVGAFGISIPVTFVAYYQFGMTAELAYIVIAYAIIQVLDGNVLVPILFGEAVNLHPVAILIAILFFGGLWGFWGVFFAIPLATVFNAVVTAWPDLTEIPDPDGTDTDESPQE
jgi:putative permease